MQPAILEGLAKGLLFTFMLADTLFCDAANATPADSRHAGKVSGKMGALLTFTALLSVPGARKPDS